MTEKPYTDADVELVARALARSTCIYDPAGDRRKAGSVLDALATAGRLASPSLDDDELDAIEMRALAATREPWHVEYIGERGYPQRIANDAAVVIAETHDGSGAPAANAEFIAHARTDVPRLIATVRRLLAGRADR